MPKSTLTFDLPEEQYEFNCATKGGDYLRTLQELYNEFRSKSKYGPSASTWGEAYDLFNRVCTENNIDPWEEG